MSIWVEAQLERERANQLHGDMSMDARPVDDLLRLAILTEEVGEVAKVFNEAYARGEIKTGDLRLLREELVQVAAMAGAWADALTPYADDDE